MRNLLVDELLPQEILRLQGKYVQTCAHIEKALWETLFYAEGYNVERDEDIHKALSIRKVTMKLRDGLGAAVKQGKIVFPDRMTAVLNEIERDIDNRHMSVHGAWSFDSDGQLRCEYHKNFDSKEEPDWRSYAAPVSLDQVSDALIAADKLLRESIELREANRKRRGAPASDAPSAG